MPEQIPPRVEGDTLVIPIPEPWEEANRRVRIGVAWPPLVAFFGVLLFARTNPLAWVIPVAVFFIALHLHRSALDLKGQTGQVRINANGLRVHYPELVPLDFVVDQADIKGITCHPTLVHDERIALLGLKARTGGVPPGGSVLVEMTDKTRELLVKPGLYMPRMEVIYDDHNKTKFTYMRAFQWQPGSGVGLELLQEAIDGAREGRMPTQTQLAALADVWGSDLLSYEERKTDRRARRQAESGQRFLNGRGRRGMPTWQGLRIPDWVYNLLERFAYLVKGLWFRRPKS